MSAEAESLSRAQPAPASAPQGPASVAVLCIGDELLSGKIRDFNLGYLASELRALGVELTLGMFVSDRPQEIVDAIRYASARAEWVFTTGGVGPTHDDLTLAAVAQAFERPLVRDPGIERAIRQHYGERVNDELLSMAEVPQGVELIQPTPFFVPIFRVEQVFVFPGDPIALQKLFAAFKERLRRSPLTLGRVELDVDEGEVAPLLRELQETREGLSVGSYPRYDEGAPYRVLVTLEAREPERVHAALTALCDLIQARFGAAALLSHGVGLRSEVGAAASPPATPRGGSAS